MIESAKSKIDVPLETPGGAVSLESILCTEELRRRPSRPPDYEKENRALVALASALADSPRTILQTLAEKVVEVLQADSAGLSLLTKDDKRFYWAAIAGAWQPCIGGGTPRDFGPCGDVLDRNVPMLFTHWERRYPYLSPATPLAEEGLLVPFYVKGKAVGTIWVIAHSDRRKFDAEDLRLLESLGRFASAAYQAVASIDVLKFQIDDREKAETALHQLTGKLETRVRVRTEELEQEIVERVRAEEVARAAQARFEGILEIADDAIISVDSNQRIVLFNQGAEKVFGYVQADVIGKPLDLLLPQRFEEVHRKHVEEFARSPDVARTMGQRREVSGRRKDGHEFPAEASISKLDLGGEIVFTVILRDITERKRAEQRLVAQHTVAQVLAETATLEEATPKILRAVCECLEWDLGELWRIDRAAGVLRCVEMWHKESIEAPRLEATRHDRTFLPGIGLPGRVWTRREPAYIPDVVQDANFPRASIAAREGLHSAFAFPILLGREVVGVMDFFRREIRLPDQDLLDMMTTIGSQIGQFIERKRAEEELRRSEAYLAEAQRLSQTGSFGWSMSSGEIFWSEQTFRIFEYDRAAEPSLELILQRTHPEDRALVQQVIDRVSQERQVFDFEHRLLMPNGSIKYLHVVAHGTKNELDQIEFVGAVTDITAAKSAEHRIQEDERELRQILDLTPQHLGVLGPDGSRLYANHAALEYFGVTIDQWRAEGSRLDLVHPDDREHFPGERKSRFLEGAPHEFEARLLRHDGKFRCFLFRLNPLKDERGHITRWYGTATDIEDRKRTEEGIRKENVALREEIDKASMFEEIVGSSEALRKVLLQVEKVAPTDSTVLITGETGTGKELVARAIHKRSARSARAFVGVNCAAIPQSLIASELFGHEKGAFTGALQRRLGRFELAEGGTIFLDEIGDLPADTQNTLLRVLQEREFERVGGTHSIRADVRVIAATNRDLRVAMSGGAFRSDLFYRLNVFPIEIPPLRERREDIPLLVEYFIDRYASKAGKKIKSINKKSLELLRFYSWPGNIRELQNVIDRAVIICETKTLVIDENWLSLDMGKSPPMSRSLSEELVAREKETIEAALAETRGRVSGPSGAAAKLGIPRSTLGSKIKSLKIDAHRFKTF
ncbi:MAG: sigma 54-interacting transcriptional regulator [Alphaproteobacteria bacterium]